MVLVDTPVVSESLLLPVIHNVITVSPEERPQYPDGDRFLAENLGRTVNSK
jgi:hypothetical protein